MFPFHRAIRRAGAFAATVAVCWIADPSAVRAACSPALPQPAGTTITCTDTTTATLGDGSQNQLTVNVVSGATVSADPAALWFNNQNIIANGGTLTSSAFGILAADNNTISNSGAISVGDSGSGIDVYDLNTVTNAGSIAVGNFSHGIAADYQNTITNNGTITGSALSVGIYVFDLNTVTNNGSIAVGDESAGIHVDTDNIVVNTGTIIAGSSGLSGPAVGIEAHVGNTITNAGLISVGAGGIGVLTVDTNTLTNTGTIKAGANGISVGVDPCGCDTAFFNTLINKGVIDGRIYLSGASPGDGFGNVVQNFGTITITDPGTAVGAVHVIDGEFIQEATGTLGLRVQPTMTPGVGLSDRMIVDQATLAGTLRAQVQPGLYWPQTVFSSVIATQCGCIGNFDQAISTSAFFSAATVVNGTDIDLILTRIPFNAVPGLTRNQQAIGNVLEAGYAPTLTGDAAIIYSNLLAQPNAGIFDTLSGEGATGTQHSAFFSGSLFSNMLMGEALQFVRDNDGASGPLSYAGQPRPHPLARAIQRDVAASRRWRPWVSATGGSRSFTGSTSDGSADVTQSGGAAALGVGYSPHPDLVVGVAVGASTGRFSASGRATSGNVAGGHVGVYGLARFENVYAAGTLSYARFDNDTTRTIAGLGPTETAAGSFASDLLSARVEVGRRLSFQRVALTPFAAIQASQLWQRGYTETSTMAGGGPGTLALAFQPTRVASVPTFLGAAVDTTVEIGDGRVVSPYIKASWMHEFSASRSISAAFVAIPVAGFTVFGASAARDAARVEAGMKFGVSPTSLLWLAFDGEFAPTMHSYAGKGGFRAIW